MWLFLTGIQAQYIYFRTVSYYPLFCSGTFEAFLTGLGQNLMYNGHIRLNPKFFAAQTQIPIPNIHLGCGCDGFVFCRNNG